MMPSGEPHRVVGMIDSGVEEACLRTRGLDFFDCSGANNPLGHRLDVPEDPVGHGTRVATVLDAALAPETGLVVAGLGPDENVTASAVATAILAVLAQKGPSPTVLNLSLHPLMEGGHRGASIHQVQLVHSVLKHYAPRVAAIMAAGNDGIPTEIPDWAAPNLIYVVALNSLGRVAKYSSLPQSPGRVVAAFGGDDPTEANGIPFFAIDSEFEHGTSLAAPLVTAAASRVPFEHIQCECWTRFSAEGYRTFHS
jgi:hypothetical protein